MHVNLCYSCPGVVSGQIGLPGFCIAYLDPRRVKIEPMYIYEGDLQCSPRHVYSDVTSIGLIPWLVCIEL